MNMAELITKVVLATNPNKGGSYIKKLPESGASSGGSKALKSVLAGAASPRGWVGDHATRIELGDDHEMELGHVPGIKRTVVTEVVVAKDTRSVEEEEHSESSSTRRLQPHAR
jgi:hypothetical protein